MQISPIVSIRAAALEHPSRPLPWRPPTPTLGANPFGVLIKCQYALSPTTISLAHRGSPAPQRTLPFPQLACSPPPPWDRFVGRRGRGKEEEGDVYIYLFLACDRFLLSAAPSPPPALLLTNLRRKCRPLPLPPPSPSRIAPDRLCHSVP